MTAYRPLHHDGKPGTLTGYRPLLRSSRAYLTHLAGVRWPCSGAALAFHGSARERCHGLPTSEWVPRHTILELSLPLEPLPGWWRRFWQATPKWYFPGVYTPRYLADPSYITKIDNKIIPMAGPTSGIRVTQRYRQSRSGGRIAAFTVRGCHDGLFLAPRVS